MTKREKILTLLLVSVVVWEVIRYLFKSKGIEIDVTDGVNLLIAFGTIGMTLIIVYIEIIKSWIQKPEIKIEFKDEDPYCRHEKTKEGLGPYFCHFVVVNRGQSQADDCEAVLERIWDSNGERDHSRWPERESWIPVNLKWSAEWFFGRKCFKTIYPGGRRYFCDIGRVNRLKNNKKFAFELPWTFISQDTFLEPGSHKI